MRNTDISPFESSTLFFPFMSPLIILFAIPFFLLLIGLEWLIGHLKKKEIYQFPDTIANLSIGIGNQAFSLFLKFVLGGLYILAYENLALVEQPASWWSYALCLITFDFLFYWAHRWGHEVNFFWAAHVVHHQSEEYNLSVALRQSWWHNLVAFVIFMPMPFMGFDPLVFFISAGIHTIYQFWIHTKLIGKLHPWVEFILNTPSHHRVHHGVNPKYIDKNHGGVFIVWDRLFGTFQAEEEEVVYGITTPFKSLNPAWANLHYYVEMGGKMLQMKGLKDKFRMLWAKPGWLPGYLGGMQGIPPVEGREPKFAPKPSIWMKVYAGVQFALLTAGLIAFMVNFDELSWFYRTAFLGIIILSGMICGAILEQKKWVLLAEYQRLALVVVCLNLLYYHVYLEWFLVMLVTSMVAFLVFNFWFTFSWILTFYHPKKWLSE